MSNLAELSLSGRLRFLAKDAVIYGIASSFNKMLALISFPLLARHFSVSDYGAIDLLNTVVLILTLLVVFGQDSAVARYFYEDTTLAYRQQVVSQSLFLQGVLAAVLVPALIMASSRIGKNFRLGPDGAFLLILVSIQVPFFLLINFSQNLLKWNYQRGRFIFISVGSALATVIAFVCGVASSDFQLVDVFVIYVLVRAFFGVLGLYWVRHWLDWPRGLGRLKEMLPFAIPYGILGLLLAALPFLERGIVYSSLGGHNLGLFAAGAKVAMLILLPITAFEMAWGPFSMSIFKHEDAARTYRWTFNSLLVALLVLVMIFSAVGERVVVLLGSHRYEGAGIVVFALAMGLAIQGLSSVLGIGSVITKRSMLKLPGYAAMIAVAAASIPFLVSCYGIAGAALGSMAGYFVKTLIEAWLSHRAYPIGFAYTRAGLIVLVAICFGIGHMLTFGRFVWYGVSVIPLVGAGVILTLGWYYFLEAGERARIISLVRRSPR